MKIWNKFECEWRVRDRCGGGVLPSTTQMEAQWRLGASTEEFSKVSLAQNTFHICAKWHNFPVELAAGIVIFSLVSGFFPVEEASMDDWRYAKLHEVRPPRHRHRALPTTHTCTHSCTSPVHASHASHTPLNGL